MSKLCCRAIVPALALLMSMAAHAGMAPDETVNTFKLAEGLEAKLFASEPEIVNPVSMDIDARGRVWIVEGANYRGARNVRPEGDRIVILEDTDKDGKADSIKVFAQDPKIFCPLGICVLGNKVYVAQSPKMLVWTIDASGDKPAGEPEVMFSGFSGVNHDHGLHSGMFGPDGRFYFNSGNDGLSGGNFDRVPPEMGANAEIKNSKGELLVDSTGSHPFPKGKIWRGQPKQSGQGYKQGMAFRCNLDGSDFEVLGHNFRNNFETTVDSFGNVWQSDNDDDGNQGVRLNYVMEGGDFGYSGWGGNVMRYPTQSAQEAHFNQRMPGVVPNLYNTGGGSPTGICVYEGNLLPEKYHGALLHTNSGGQWYGYVGAFTTTPAGAGWKCELTELVTNPKDNFFKPDDVCVAPDGAVFISDWYDGQSGGHGLTDKTPGKQMGRIYRLAPTGNKPALPKLDLDSVAGQITALCSPNHATRYLAYTKLVNGGAEAEKALKELYSSSKNQRHRARALWLLARQPDGKTHVQEALKDNNPEIRVTALRAARLIKMDMISIANQMLEDKDYHVLGEIAVAMNYQPTDKAMPILVALADKIDPNAPEAPVFNPKERGKNMAKLAEEEKERQERYKNRWFIEAVGIGAIGREKELLEAWKSGGKNKDPKLVAVMEWRMNKIIPEVVKPATPAPAK
ncbi:MAG TPA: PVC-type heme-binding CxxCH protein [Planctomycetota bacterium]|nr:PVC-type heme-binding CxxCH protein [Planctomycetota bacterium]